MNMVEETMYEETIYESNINLVIFDLDDTLICTRTSKFLYDVEKLLKTLKDNGYKIGMASYNPYADYVLKKRNLYDYFDFIEYEDWRFKKILDLKENMIKTILEKANTKPEHSLFIDDQVLCIETARTLGLKTYIYTGEDMNNIIEELVI